MLVFCYEYIGSPISFSRAEKICIIEIDIMYTIMFMID